ncbi:hypothetical protein [Streptomyces vastus]|uniref:Uncharacterized protein n=1 Tax=Streptomyces vastus TaxID=285451 RepID=A0ABP6CWC9_9ACTN
MPGHGTALPVQSAEEWVLIEPADGALGLRRLPFSAGSRAPAGAGPDPHRRGAAADGTGWATGRCLTGLVSRLIITGARLAGTWDPRDQGLGHTGSPLGDVQDRRPPALALARRRQ